MKVASRFFMCDTIREKDTTIGYHVCIAINGTGELETTRDYTVLEAFCFEAIFSSLRGKPKFIEDFNNFVTTASRDDREHFIDFQTHLTIVKKKCYESMEKDQNLENTLMKYYNQNIDNINFKIE